MQHGFDWNGQKLDGFLLCEKFDGCRAYWDGAQLWTRSGNVIPAPQWFLDALPKGVHLDGEIWAGRGNFSQARSAVNFGGRHFTPQIQFVVFDAPHHAGTWSERVASVSKNETVVPVEWFSTNDVHARFAAVKAGGGEGLIAHRNESQYKAGRTFDVLKIKHADQFAK